MDSVNHDHCSQSLSKKLCAAYNQYRVELKFRKQGKTRVIYVMSAARSRHGIWMFERSYVYNFKGDDSAQKRANLPLAKSSRLARISLL